MLFDVIFIYLYSLATNRNDNRKKDFDMGRTNSFEGSKVAENGDTNQGFTSPAEYASNGSTAQRSGEGSSGLYDMPGMSAKTSRKSNTPDHASSCDNAGYAIPAGVDNMEGEEDLHALYARSSKYLPEPEGGNMEETGDLYVNMNGLSGDTPAAPDEDVAALYTIMPDKRKSVNQDYEIMIDSELYSST